MREQFKEWMIIGLVVAAIALFPVCGATFHFLVRASLAKQQMLDTEGVPIAARLVNKQSERNVHLDRRVGISQRGTRTEVICHIEVEYSIAGLKDIHRQSSEFDDPRLCDRYRVGDTISGRALPSDPQVMLLDANRVGAHWYWISLFLMVGFIALPVLGGIKLIRDKNKPRTAKEPDDSNLGRSVASSPLDIEVRD